MSRRVVIIEGKEYESMKEACDTYSMELPTVYYRMRKGMSLTEAITTPLITKHDSNIVINGESFKNLYDIATKYNISYYTLFYRVKKAKWPINDAVSTPVRVSHTKNITKKIIASGKEYESIKIFSDSIGVKYQTAGDRCRKKLNFVKYDDKITRAEYSGDLRKRPIAGFSSIKDASAATGIAIRTIQKRLKLGWSEYDAVYTQPHQPRKKYKI